MHSKAFKDRVKRLQEVNSVIKKVDPAIRGKAFELLMSYVEGGREEDRPRPPTNGGSDEVTDAESFFLKYPDKTPGENALIVVAYFFSQYGSHPFTLKQVRKIADDAGLTVPARLDMTFLGTKRDGKALFQRGGRGEFRLTVPGETAVKTEFKVKKGTKKPSAETKKQ